jgi:hypothetical protein
MRVGMWAGQAKQQTLVLTQRSLQRRETVRRERSAGGEVFRRAGGEGAVAVRLAVAAIGEHQRNVVKRDGRTERTVSRPIHSDKRKGRRYGRRVLLQIHASQRQILQRCAVCLLAAGI